MICSLLHIFPLNSLLQLLRKKLKNSIKASQYFCLSRCDGFLLPSNAFPILNRLSISAISIKYLPSHILFINHLLLNWKFIQNQQIFFPNWNNSVNIFKFRASIGKYQFRMRFFLLFSVERKLHYLLHRLNVKKLIWTNS